jgi:predicted PurR-regulated permease PerM
MNFNSFENLCTPAKLYFAIAVISCIFALFSGFSFLAVFVKLLFAFIWTYILTWLCKKGYKTISWVLVLLPYIVILLGFFGIIIFSKQHKMMLNSIKLQGPFGDENFTNPKKH